MQIKNRRHCLNLIVSSCFSIAVCFSLNKRKYRFSCPGASNDWRKVEKFDSIVWLNEKKNAQMSSIKRKFVVLSKLSLFIFFKKMFYSIFLWSDFFKIVVYYRRQNWFHLDFIPLPLCSLIRNKSILFDFLVSLPSYPILFVYYDYIHLLCSNFLPYCLDTMAKESCKNF